MVAVAEQVFEAQHNLTAEALCLMYKLPYYTANNSNDLRPVLAQFLGKRNKLAVLEIKTPRELNAEILKEYFNYIKEGK